MDQRRSTRADRDGIGCVDSLTDAFGPSGSDDIAVVLVTAGDEWGFALDASRSSALVAVAGGMCWLRRPEGPPVELIAGDIALVPATREGHGLAGKPHGELSDHETMVTGRFSCNGSGRSIIYAAYQPLSPARRLFATLYELIVVKAEVYEQRGVIDETLGLLVAELNDRHPGCQTAVSRLLDVLVVHMLRAWFATAQSGGAGREGAGSHLVFFAVTESGLLASEVDRKTIGNGFDSLGHGIPKDADLIVTTDRIWLGHLQVGSAPA